jgi:DNA-binding IclR family transcriptional regulator
MLRSGDQKPPSDLLDRLATVRRRGHDEAEPVLIPGLAAISAPNLDVQEQAIACLILIGASVEVNDLRATMVLVGTLVGTRDAANALQIDSQMVSRATPFEVPRCRETEGFRRLLPAFEHRLPIPRES